VYGPNISIDWLMGIKPLALAVVVWCSSRL